MTYYNNLTPELTKILALNSIRNCVLEQHLSIICEPGLFQCFPNAVWQMGVDYYTLDDETEHKLRECLHQVKLSADDNLHKSLDQIAERIYTEWQAILKR